MDLLEMTVTRLGYGYHKQISPFMPTFEDHYELEGILH
jgi:hypothetical protein